MFWWESEILVENEMIYPIDTLIKCTLCGALNIVLWERVNINCTKILKADTKQPWKLSLLSHNFDIFLNGQQIQQWICANWINCLLYTVLLNVRLFPVLNKNCTEPYLGLLHRSCIYICTDKNHCSIFGG